MMYEQAAAADPAQTCVVRTCALSQGCGLVAEMRAALNALQQTNDELQDALAELDRLASTDKLTGAWNRRRLEETVANEMDRLRRYDHPLSLLILDIDFFKRINDRYGHAAGDRLLVEFAAQVRSVLRTTDSLTRWGGEEFLVLCPETAHATAALFAERLRIAIAQMDFAVAEQITVSIGAAECLPDESWELWFGRADAMLLQAKAAGRNQVRIAPEIPQRADSALADTEHLVRLVWQRSYECGHAAVDREHQSLFRDANELLAAILAGRPALETGALVDAMMADVLRHFQHEESTIRASGFPGAAKHAALHVTLIDRAGALIDRFRGGESGAGEMFQFLADEVIARHILGADRDYFPYLECQRQAAHA